MPPVSQFKLTFMTQIYEDPVSQPKLIFITHMCEDPCIATLTDLYDSNVWGPLYRNQNWPLRLKCEDPWIATLYWSFWLKCVRTPVAQPKLTFMTQMCEDPSIAIQTDLYDSNVWGPLYHNPNWSLWLKCVRTPVAQPKLTFMTQKCEDPCIAIQTDFYDSNVWGPLNRNALLNFFLTQMCGDLVLQR